MTGVATSLREHGLRIGDLEPGPRCSIVDVGGVRVGHVTVVRDKPEIVRKGVTAIVPAPVETLFAQPLRAGRIARGAGLGLARAGSTAHPGSGEIFLALSTARGADALPDGDLHPLFAATIDATEEAVVNALWHAETTVGREGRVAHALPRDAVLELLDGHRRLGVR
jgi:D-aminopeptidase